MRDYYLILQVRPDADAEVIAAAYRTLARKYHPDHFSGSDAGARMRELNKAYEILSDPSRRGEYDAARAPRPVPLVQPPPVRWAEAERGTVEQETAPPQSTRPARRRRSARPLVLSLMWFSGLVGAIAATWVVWQAEFDAPPPLPSPRVTVVANVPAATPLGLPYRSAPPSVTLVTPTPGHD
jgi:hypothetical protein